MDNKAAIRFTWVLLILLIIVTGIRIYLDIRNEGVIDRATQLYIEARVSEEIEKIERPRDGTNGYTPVKDVDYFDGRDGQDGADGADGEDGAPGKSGEKGEDGKDAYFEIRCNTEKNRWEVLYSVEENWQVLNGEPIPCTVGES